ncbi:hypothetical protein YPPY14_3931, partial [Yersinia pestis PY-14]
MRYHASKRCITFVHFRLNRLFINEIAHIILIFT